MTKLSLRPFAAGHLALLVRWLDSPRTLFHWTGIVLPFPLGEEELEREVGKPGGGERLRLVAERGAGPIAYVELGDVRPTQGSGYVNRAIVDPRHRGNGVGAGMIEQLLAHAFRDRGLHRVGVTVYERNAAARACYERVGFVQEGRLREANRFEGEYQDLIVMSMLVEEWTRRHDGQTA